MGQEGRGDANLGWVLGDSSLLEHAKLSQQLVDNAVELRGDDLRPTVMQSSGEHN